MLKNLLKKTDGLEDLLNKTKIMCMQYDEIIIFGAGIGGRQAYDFLVENGLENKLKGFSDNNTRKIGTQYCNFLVFNPIELFNKFPHSIILVASTAFLQIMQSLVTYGYSKDSIIYFQLAGITSEEEKQAEFIWKHISELEQTYQWLEDEKSKKIFLNILNYRICKKEEYLQQLSNYIDNEENQYFDEELVSLKKITSFVDAGSYIGDTIRNLYNLVGHEKIKCYCFEADPEIYELLKKEIINKNWYNVEPFLYGVWNKKENLYLDTQTSQNGGSRIKDSGTEQIKAEALDNLLKGKKIGFIKMDVEGAETNALKGARRIIQEQTPILAICIYHKPGDFYEIPSLIKEMDSNYKLYIRQYRYGQSETVCYAIPKEKNQ